MQPHTPPPIWCNCAPFPLRLGQECARLFKGLESRVAARKVSEHTYDCTTQRLQSLTKCMLWQYVVYNTILRKQPADLYDKFKQADNLFPTTIFVLASAVLKVSRAMKLSKDLILYRGLGGTTDLPDSYFKLDEYGCRGFSDFGFMSTTANKQVAINYCGITKQKPLPLVLAIRVGATDRGACVRDFSQYMSEVEYLFAPCSFIEPDGPDYLEVNRAGVVRIIPVRVKASAKSNTVDDLEVRKKTLHLSAFKYRVHEIEMQLAKLACNHHAEQRLAEDRTRDTLVTSGAAMTVEGFVSMIVGQCKEVYSRHEAVSPDEYNDDTRFRSLVLEMVEVREMAEAKLCEWMENKKGALIRFRYGAKLRTAHRRWIAFLHRQLIKSPKDQKVAMALRLLKTRGLVVDSVEEVNELGENRLMASAADGRYSVIEMLVDASAQVNCARPQDGVSAIWLAAQFGQCLTIETLVRFNAEVNHCASNGASPTYIAAQMGNSKCIETLHRLKADVNLADRDGIAPAHMAAMNGRTGCIILLNELEARLDDRNKEGKTPFELASDHGHDDAARLIEELIFKRAKQKTPPRTEMVKDAVIAMQAASRSLIITTGDVSDVDGFLALAEYAKTGADVLFVMNYPAYIGVSEAEASDPRNRDYAKNNPGLGYRYSATEVLKSTGQMHPRAIEYEKYFEGCKQTELGGENERMKSALTDLAFCMAVQVWKEACSQGRLLFHIGGINSVNPFSETAIKNEVLVYAPLVQCSRPFLDAQQGQTYDTERNKICLNISGYSDIYLDFNGSMAFWNEEWATLLSEKRAAKSLRGVFIMGGVYDDKEPVTSPPIPGKLNRFSSATMNQLYHPECAASFFRFVEQHGVQAFIVTNNSVRDLTTTNSVTKAKTYEGIERFLDANGLQGTYLRSFAKVHYESIYNPPRKPFDMYTARALTMWLKSKDLNTEESLCSHKRFLFYSNVFGICIVSKLETWEEVRDRYAGRIGPEPRDEDPVAVRNKKEFFLKEVEILKSITYMARLSVFDVHLDIDPSTSAFKIVMDKDD